MSLNYRKIMGRLLATSVLVSLVGCSSDPTADLEVYVEEVKNNQTASIEPLPEFEPYESFTYDAVDLRDPFTPPVFSHPKTTIAQASGNGIKPDFDRASEPL